MLAPAPTRRAVVSSRADLARVYQPLCPRLGLVQVRDDEQWSVLQHAAPGIGPKPDFAGGTLVGVVSCIGTPLDGAWPLRLDSVRVFGGAGLVNSEFNAGTYLPDGTAYLETAFVPNLTRVLVVEVNGVRFYPR